MTLIDALSENSLFRDLTESEIKNLPVQYNLLTRKFSAGNIIRMQGDHCRNLLLIVEGEISASMQKPDGKSIIVEHLKAPDAAASAIVFSDHGILPVTLIADTDVIIATFDKEVLLNIFQRHKKVLVSYLSDMGNKVSFLADKIRYLQMHSLRQKIIFYIKDLLLRQKSTTIVFDKTLETLSEMFGVTRPSLSRELGQLVALNLLSRSGKGYTIPDAEKLFSLLLDI